MGVMFLPFGEFFGVGGVFAFTEDPEGAVVIGASVSEGAVVTGTFVAEHSYGATDARGIDEFLYGVLDDEETGIAEFLLFLNGDLDGSEFLLFLFHLGFLS